MIRGFLAIFSILFAVAACTETDPNARKVFWISSGDVADIQFRHLDAVNAIRADQGLSALSLSAELTAAAKTHATDISRQNRPWHFGSDGSNPPQRVARTGYLGAFVSENISESFESDLETLQAWMRDPVTRSGIMRSDAVAIGLSWFQEPTGKIWWVQVIGG